MNCGNKSKTSGDGAEGKGEGPMSSEISHSHRSIFDSFSCEVLYKYTRYTILCDEMHHMSIMIF